MQAVKAFIRRPFWRKDDGAVAVEYLFIAFVAVAIGLALFMAIRGGALTTVLTGVVINLIEYFLGLFLGV